MREISNSKKIVIIGAGIIGSCCALKLIRQGYKVVLIDKESPGSGCSYGNAGGISSGSIIPMALPGIWKKVPSWLMDKEGPLSVKWGYLPKVSPWLYKWIVSSSEESAKYASQALANLNRDVIEAYKALLTERQFDDLIKLTGHFYAYRKEPNSRGDVLANMLRKSHGVEFEEVFNSELQDVEPALSKELNYGIYIKNASFTVNPERLVCTIVENFKKEGGEFIQDEVKLVESRDTGGVSVTTRVRNVKADAAVVAAGAWSKKLMQEDLRKLPLENERGYHLMLSEPTVMPCLPIISGDYKFFATPMEYGLRIAGTVEICGMNSLPNWRRAELLLKHAKKIFPGLSASGSKAWVGDRPSFPSSVPLIDASSRHKNVFYAFGHGHYGMSGGPGTAEIICNLIKKSGHNFDIEPFSYEKHLS